TFKRCTVSPIPRVANQHEFWVSILQVHADWSGGITATIVHNNDFPVCGDLGEHLYCCFYCPFNVAFLIECRKDYRQTSEPLLRIVLKHPARFWMSNPRSADSQEPFGSRCLGHTRTKHRRRASWICRVVRFHSFQQRFHSFQYHSCRIGRI